jgi:outer membrane receptor for ferrienterochelin and colicins
MKQCVLFLLLVFNLNTHAQELSGYVFELNESGKEMPLYGATIRSVGNSFGAISDTTGYFTIRVDSTVDKIVISYLGFQDDTLHSNQFSTPLRIVLKDLQSLEQVEIVSSQGSNYMQSINPMLTQVMTEGELKKAACCNLSESFETNPSIDVNYADAVSGIRQINMLGLSGVYSPLTTELVPLTRGLSSHTGLTFIPGPWVESIQVTKGIGSVSNGYESISGQINVELKKPGKGDQLYANAYRNAMGRSEGNVLLGTSKGAKLGSVLLIHANTLDMKTDANGDHFMDLPTGKQFNALNRWKYESKNGFIAQVGLQALIDERKGGTMHWPNAENVGDSSLYLFSNDNKRFSAFAKVGYVLPGPGYKSVGLITNAYRSDLKSVYGKRDYTGVQQSGLAQLIYESIIGNTRHKYRAGLSLIYDKYDERFQNLKFYRTEIAGGAFLEYTYNSSKKTDLIAGIRYDQHSLFGPIFTPRVHFKYAFTSKTTLRASFGRGQRTASIFTENAGMFVSSRTLTILPESNTGTAYGLKPEIAWNSGISFVHNFKLNYREGSIVVDVFRTDFTEQVIADLDQDPQQIVFYNLKGRSYSNSAQAEFSYQPLRRFDIRIAYRYTDARSTYHDVLLNRPFVASHRSFVNLAYKTKSRFHFDYTVNFTGKKRIPSTAGNPPVFQQSEWSPSFVTMNAQVSKQFFKKNFLDVYLGCENVTDFKQKNLIISADQPQSNYFDASLVWGPVIGRMFYAGLRYNIPVKGK